MSSKSRRKKRRSTEKRTVRDWLQEKRPFIQFVGLFLLLMTLFYLSTLSSLFQDHFFPWYLNLNAAASGAVIGLFWDNVQVSGSNVISPAFSINIARGCDATGPIALFIPAVLAFSLPWPRKIIGVIVGTLLLVVANFIRIISLFFIGIYWPDAFHIMHVDVWQAAFIFLVVVLWLIWVQWSFKKMEPATASS